MSAVIFVIIFALILGGYAFMSLKVNKVYVQCVEAGPTDTITAKELKRRSLYVSSKKMLDRDGNILDPDVYFRVVVNGNCLRPRNIVDGDTLIIQKKDDNVLNSIHAESIVLILLPDTGVHKIREVKDVEANNLRTQYYLNNGQAQESSKLHSKENVVGVVRYKL